MTAQFPKGWFHIPRVQNGDRSLVEQMEGLAPALAEAHGKTIADLGCAEGLIALEFAKVGATDVVGVDYNVAMIDVARRLWGRNSALPVRFLYGDVKAVKPFGKKGKFDIVLALAVLHKLLDPADGVRFCADLAASLLVIRLPIGSTGAIVSKHGANSEADICAILPTLGFTLDKVLPGPRGELVQYWRRNGDR